VSKTKVQVDVDSFNKQVADLQVKLAEAKATIEVDLAAGQEGVEKANSVLYEAMRVEGERRKKAHEEELEQKIRKELLDFNEPRNKWDAEWAGVNFFGRLLMAKRRPKLYTYKEVEASVLRYYRFRPTSVTRVQAFHLIDPEQQAVLEAHKRLLDNLSDIDRAIKGLDLLTGISKVEGAHVLTLSLEHVNIIDHAEGVLAKLT